MADPSGLIRGARLTGGWRQPGIGGQCCGTVEGLAGGLGDEDRSGPDGDPWHGSQDRVKRVRPTHGFKMRGHVGPLGMQGDQLPGQVRNDQTGGLGANHDCCLLIHGVQDGVGPRGVPAGSVLCELRVDPGLAGML